MSGKKLEEFVWNFTFGPERFETETRAEKLKIESNLEFARAVAEFVEKETKIKMLEEAIAFCEERALVSSVCPYPNCKNIGFIVRGLNQKIEEAKR